MFKMYRKIRAFSNCAAVPAVNSVSELKVTELISQTFVNVYLLRQDSHLYELKSQKCIAMLLRIVMETGLDIN